MKQTKNPISVLGGKARAKDAESLRAAQEKGRATQMSRFKTEKEKSEYFRALSEKRKNKKTPAK